MKIRYIYTTAALFLFTILMSAQGDVVKNANLSPYHVIYNHLFYLQPDSYDAELAARSLGDSTSLDMIDKAIKLKEISFYND